MPSVQTRGVKTLDFAGTKEEVYERSDWPRGKFQVCQLSFLILTVRNTSRMIHLHSSDMVLKGNSPSRKEVLMVRHGQGLNLRDNGMNVIVGVRRNGTSWNQAVEDGWVPDKNLFDIEEAIKRGTIVMNLLSVLLSQNPED
jgi:ketol-acid reductoisomerase